LSVVGGCPSPRGIGCHRTGGPPSSATGGGGGDCSNRMCECGTARAATPGRDERVCFGICLRYILERIYLENPPRHVGGKGGLDEKHNIGCLREFGARHEKAVPLFPPGDSKGWKAPEERQRTQVGTAPTVARARAAAPRNSRVREIRRSFLETSAAVRASDHRALREKRRRGGTGGTVEEKNGRAGGGPEVRQWGRPKPGGRILLARIFTRDSSSQIPDEGGLPTKRAISESGGSLCSEGRGWKGEFPPKER